ncbi:trimethylamine methyltransferase family protein [uncultured Roseibium sp.]|uniref:trimethylamine methyltransferase family protein n=1 Tax=uncultured Roseibium sp. TaxID=1936171 RepID=UPI002627A7D2|nr:trimethylamine methyltransferase family protein [uncultured Roseibium sp.]
MTGSEVKQRRRSGGRSARTAARARPLDDAVRPVWPGMPGGRYRPLKEADVKRIHEAALQALEVIGFGSAPASGRAYLKAAGAIEGEDGRIRFPRALVEDMLAKAARDITLNGRDPKFDLHLTGTNVHFGTAGAAVHIVDPTTGDYRNPNVQDLYNTARLVQQLDNVHFFQRPLVCREFESPRDLDINTAYAACAGTTKHIGLSFTEAANVAPALELLHLMVGGEDAWRQRPFVSNTNCFVVPPLTFAEESCEVMEACILAGMPVLLLSAGQAGATAPAPIATAVVQAVAECLAGVVYVNAVKPGHPAVFGTWPFVSDLRTGAMSGGSGEQALLSAACAQMHQFYGLPGGAAAGIADSKLPDMQAGWEQGISNVMAGLSGLNMVYEAAGMHASLLGFCLESLVLGNDMLGQVLRCVRGVEVKDEFVDIEVIRSVVLDGPGHYLGHDQTLKLMQSEYIYPDLADRTSPKEWEERGRPRLLDSAQEKMRSILSQDGHTFDQATEDALRAAQPLAELVRP